MLWLAVIQESQRHSSQRRTDRGHLLTLLNPLYVDPAKPVLMPQGFTHAGMVPAHPNYLVSFDRIKVVAHTSMINHTILPCHHCQFCLFTSSSVSHILTPLPGSGDTVQHLPNLPSLYPGSPKPTNVLHYGFVCRHLAQHMLTRSSSHVSELLFQTLHIHSYHQLLTTGVGNFHHNN